MQPWFWVATICPNSAMGVICPFTFALMLLNISVLILPGFKFSNSFYDAFMIATRDFYINSRSISSAFARDCLMCIFSLAYYSFASFFLLCLPPAKEYWGTVRNPSLEGCTLNPFLTIKPNDLNIKRIIRATDNQPLDPLALNWICSWLSHLLPRVCGDSPAQPWSLTVSSGRYILSFCVLRPCDPLTSFPSLCCSSMSNTSECLQAIDRPRPTSLFCSHRPCWYRRRSPGHRIFGGRQSLLCFHSLRTGS